VKTCFLEAGYEPLRTWALSPSPTRPPGVAQLLRGGMVTWAYQMQPLPSVQGSEAWQPSISYMGVTPLSMIVAAMIAEVCQ